MKYSSTNRLEDFEFHDARLSLISWQDNCLIVSAKYLNVHKDAAPDHTGADMEISEARITFTEFRIKEFESSRAGETDGDRQSYTDAVAHTMFENELRNSIEIMSIDLINDIYELEALGMDPYFTVRFVFSDVVIEWDKYRKKAWYNK